MKFIIFVFYGDFFFAVISGLNLQLKERFAVGHEYFRFVRQNLNIKFLAYRNSLFGNACNVWPLLVSCEVRNELFSVKVKNSYET